MCIPTRRCDKAYLDDYCEEHKVRLIGKYENVNTRTRITGWCNGENCTAQFSKIMENMLDHGGPFCKKCVRKNNLVMKTGEKRREFSTDSLETFCDKGEIELIGDYENVDANTKITGKCKGENCDGIFCKIFVYLFEKGGPFCEDCVIKNIREKRMDMDQHSWDTNFLKLLCDEREIRLVGNHENVNVKTIITGVCNGEECDELFSKSFELLEQTGPFCKKCTHENGREKAKETCMKNWGVFHPSLVDEIRERSRATSMRKYGFPSPMQNPQIAAKASKAARKPKPYKFPSGDIRIVQGYEPFALDELVKDYEEDDIITGVVNVPMIKYTSADGKNRVHFPDTYLKSENFLVEVKSTWTLKCKGDSVFEKQAAAKAQGFRYEIWSYDYKRNKTVYA